MSRDPFPTKIGRQAAEQASGREVEEVYNETVAVSEVLFAREFR